MPAPIHVRLTFSGVLGTTPAPEIWSFGLSLTPGTLASSTDSARSGALAAIAGAARDAYGLRLANQASGAVLLNRVRAALVGDDGKVGRTSAGKYQQEDVTASIQGSGTHTGLAFQTALAVRVESDFAGPTGRGRFYFPLPSTGSQVADGLIPPTKADSLASSFVQFLDDINTAGVAASTSILCIASGGSAARGLNPQLHPIRRVRIGRVMDTMRSRRNNLGEDYRTLPLVVR